MVTRNAGQKTRKPPSRSGGNTPPPRTQVDDADDPDDELDEDEDQEDSEDDDTFTQAEVNDILRKRVGKAQRQAVRKVLDDLGLESVEALKTALAKKEPAAPPAKKSSDTKDDDGNAEPVDVEAIRKEAETAANKKIAERDLTDKIKENIVDTYGLTMKQAARLRTMVTVDADADDDEIRDALEDLEQDFPDLFTRGSDRDDTDDDRNSASGKRSPRRDSDGRDRPESNPGRGPRRRRGKAPDVKSAARTLLIERHPQLSKK
jgi:hypothetical protein